jgi:CcmD family protein
MKTLIRVVAVVFGLAGFGFSVPDSTATLLAQEQPKQQEDFTPIDQLPPQEEYPALPLLVGAYAFVLLMLFGYVFVVSRRLGVIQSEVDRLDRDLKRTGGT